MPTGQRRRTAGDSGDAPIRVNPAPVLTLWAAVVAERMGHAPDTALSLASAVAGTAAHGKARLPEPAVHRAVVSLLGMDVPVVETPEGMVLAAGTEGVPVPAEPVRAYIARAFGSRLADARDALQRLGASFPPDELNRVGWQLYKRFRPEAPSNAKSWTAKTALHLGAVKKAGRPPI